MAKLINNTAPIKNGTDFQAVAPKLASGAPDYTHPSIPSLLERVTSPGLRKAIEDNRAKALAAKPGTATTEKAPFVLTDAMLASEGLTRAQYDAMQDNVKALVLKGIKAKRPTRPFKVAVSPSGHVQLSGGGVRRRTVTLFRDEARAMFSPENVEQLNAFLDLNWGNLKGRPADEVE